MDRFCFVHAADLHLDTPFEGLRSTAPWVSEALRDASLDAWDALVALCLEREAAFLLLAGDLYDGPERGLRAQLRFRAGLERLSQAGIDVFVVHGNHDPVPGAGDAAEEGEGWSAIRDWPPGTTVFGSAGVEAVRVEREGLDGERCLATVHGISFGRRDVAENLALRFPRKPGSLPFSPAPEAGLRIGLLHCNVGRAREHAPYSPCSLEDLAGAEIDYWALGHVHRYTVLSDGAPWVVYPGNLQGRSPHATEQGAKGAVVVEVAADARGRFAVENLELVALDRVRFLDVDQDVSACADLAEAQRLLAAAAAELRSAHPGRGLMLRARLLGRSPLHADLARGEGAAALLEALRDGEDRAPGGAFVWWAAVESEVRRPLDREAARERDDVAGELLRLTAELGERPEGLLAFAREALAELPADLEGVALPALEDALPDREALAALVEAAEEAAFEGVLGGEEVGS